MQPIQSHFGILGGAAFDETGIESSAQRASSGSPPRDDRKIATCWRIVGLDARQLEENELSALGELQISDVVTIVLHILNSITSSVRNTLPVNPSLP